MKWGAPLGETPQDIRRVIPSHGAGFNGVPRDMLNCMAFSPKSELCNSGTEAQ